MWVLDLKMKVENVSCLIYEHTCILFFEVLLPFILTDQLNSVIAYGYVI